MSKAGLWKKDWFLGLVVAVLVVLPGSSDRGPSVALKTYDLDICVTPSAPSDGIAVIVIDGGRITNVARYGEQRPDHRIGQANLRVLPEMQTEGRRNGPDVGLLFDGGEEHDLGYIGAAFPSGRSFGPYTVPGTRLPGNQLLFL